MAGEDDIELTMSASGCHEGGPDSVSYLHGSNPGFFNIFEKTQARKNSTLQKTQRFFRPKLNKPVAIVVTSKLILSSALLL